jgi:hypothetical protein
MLQQDFTAVMHAAAKLSLLEEKLVLGIYLYLVNKYLFGLRQLCMQYYVQEQRMFDSKKKSELIMMHR